VAAIDDKRPWRLVVRVWRRRVRLCLPPALAHDGATPQAAGLVLAVSRGLGACAPYKTQFVGKFNSGS
jgi:hypothetical protein